MTRKDYKAIADSLHRTMNKTANMPSIEVRVAAQTAIRAAVYDLADTLAADNPRFDRTQFLQACGVAP